MKNLMGNYTDMAEKIAASCLYPYSFLSDEWDDINIWQRLVRGFIFDLLSYNPPRTALNPKVLISSFVTLLTSAFGKSILLMTGIIVKFASRAKK